MLLLRGILFLVGGERPTYEMDTPSQPSRRKYGSIPNSFVYTDLDTSSWFF
jgi:hypothetical protein